MLLRFTAECLYGTGIHILCQRVILGQSENHESAVFKHTHTHIYIYM